MDPKSPEAEAARARLHAERVRVEGLLGSVRAEYREDGPISKSGDAAADTAAAEANIGLQQDLEVELDEIAAALQRVDDGTYGIDEITGEPINPARLEAMPIARTNT